MTPIRLLCALAALFAVSTAIPAAAQSDDLLLACTVTKAEEGGTGRLFHLDVSFATQLVTYTYPNGSSDRYQNGLMDGDQWNLFAMTSQTAITFGGRGAVDPRQHYEFTIDRTTGEMIGMANGRETLRYACVPETRAVKF
jgi:hypothetical protein